MVSLPGGIPGLAFRALERVATGKVVPEPRPMNSVAAVGPHRQTDLEETR